MSTIFQKSFVIFMPDSYAEALIGQEVYVADSIMDLIKVVEGNGETTRLVRLIPDSSFPFVCTDGGMYLLIYYDPYICYRRAQVQGRRVQVSYDGTTFEDCDVDELSGREPVAIRTVPTNRDVSRWLAQGHGQVRYADGTISTSHLYSDGADLMSADTSIKIRPWGSSDWTDVIDFK